MVSETRDAIRDVALELFSQHGYDKTSLREIADRLGMTKAALYYHYPSKQALLLAMIEPMIAEWRTVADTALTLPHSRENVREVLRDWLEVLLRHRPIAWMFTRDASALLEAIGPIYGDLTELTVRLNSWLAGPSPTTADRVRAVAAAELLRASLAPALLDASDAEVRRVLLDAAEAVLGG
jgi:AcrR family transcriptional regulator